MYSLILGLATIISILIALAVVVIMVSEWVSNLFKGEDKQEVVKHDYKTKWDGIKRINNG